MGREGRGVYMWIRRGAGETVDMVRRFAELNSDTGGGDGVEVEVVIAHGWEWRRDNGHRFLPGHL